MTNSDKLKIYKVGGCIRDRLLGIPVTDNDFVVVGSTPQQMLKMGFKQVGRDFPVFLHPKTREEYALARSEKKTAGGYHGFTCQTSTNISLIDDLRRRDITINAIAEDQDGKLIDPFGGINDLKLGIIRHVSEAFVEDPLRVLRVARISAKLNFIVAADTLQLMRHIVDNNELQLLSNERIWLEVQKALYTHHCSNFFSILHQVGAFNKILPQLAGFSAYSPHFNSFEIINNTLDSVDKKFALLCYFINRSDNNSANKDINKAHIQHIKNNINNITLINNSLDNINDNINEPQIILSTIKDFIVNAAVNNKAKDLANKLLVYYAFTSKINNLDSQDILSLITKLDPLRRKDAYHNFIELVDKMFIV